MAPGPSDTAAASPALWGLPGPERPDAGSRASRPCGQHHQELMTECRQVINAPAGDQIAVGDDGLVAVFRPGGADVVSNPRGAGRAPTAEGAGADEELRAVADGRNAAVLLHERPSNVDRLL